MRIMSGRGRTTGRATWAMIALLAVWAGCSRESSKPATPPTPTAAKAKYNVLLVTLDTTRADRLGCYGYDRPTSPRLDALAADAVRFDQAIAQAALTPISHASILTGLNPYEHGLRLLHGVRGYTMNDKCVTLAELLRPAGCRTGAFVSAFPCSQRYTLNRGFDEFFTGFDYGRAAREAVAADGQIRVDEFQCRADVVTDAAIRWINDGGEPFFAWVHYFDPHDAVLQPPAGSTPTFEPRGSTPEDKLRAVYDAEVSYMDAQFGRLLDALKQKNAYDKTVIVVVADHGEGLGDHNWWHHGALWQEQIRVPLLVRVPGGPKGMVVGDLVRTIDIFPTIAEAVGVPHKPVTGESMMPLLHGEKEETPRVAYAECCDPRSGFADDFKARTGRPVGNMYAIVHPEWKYIWHELNEDSSELYHLADDPREQTNLLPDATPAHQEIEAELLKTLVDWAGNADNLNPRRLVPTDAGNAAAQKALQDLGYLASGGDDDALSTQPTTASATAPTASPSDQ